MDKIPIDKRTIQNTLKLLNLLLKSHEWKPDGSTLRWIQKLIYLIGKEVKNA